INKRTLEALIRAGALDRLGPHYHDELKAYQATVDLNRAVLLALAALLALLGGILGAYLTRSSLLRRLHQDVLTLGQYLQEL
ncbi:hypothetical protein CJU33_33095, partial [Pseudomonas aeruginosa]|uniref:hypothetical protein n=1 Tax=Pseudomonas aeruginosa TaxID=287 RepID=UPI000BD26853